MTIVLLLVLVVSVIGASLASQRAVTAALRVTEKLGVSPALVGVTVMAIGTDLPEIANSLVSSASGHGDINVGDSMGSVVTQVTLVLGLLCLFSDQLRTERPVAVSVGLATVVASITVWLLLSDGELSHVDGAVLLALWAMGTALVGRRELQQEAPVMRRLDAGLGLDVLKTLLYLAVVGGFAIGVVQSFIAIASTLGIPEFVGSFVALSIGTSLPELMVDWTAIRRGASSMAIGDIFGSSFVDATLSIGVGPLVFAAAVSSEVVFGVAATAIGVLVATVLVARSEQYGRRLGLALLGVYAAVQLSTSIAAG